MTGARMVSNSISHMDQDDAKSVRSYRSTHSTRSSVLERAREYNKRLDEQKTRRSQSLERQEQASSEVSYAASGTTPRSQSAGRISSNSHQGNRPATRERAMASIQRESAPIINTSVDHDTVERRTSNNGSYNTASSGQRASPQSVEAAQGTPRSRASHNGGGSAYSSHVSRPKPTTPRMSDASSNQYSGGRSSNPRRGAASQQQQQSPRGRDPRQSLESNNSSNNNNNNDRHQHPVVAQPTPPSRSTNNNSRNNAPTPRESPARSLKSHQPREENHEGVVTPELLVDALSGHEDGLLAIAERLMEHYDSGYDVMGEAIIDAFADVQKLFQHVVEAAHMEGAAFESSRREEEIAELRKQAAAAGDNLSNSVKSPTQSAGGPTRHDEFIDQDVKDILTESIRKGVNYRNSNKFTECYQLYEGACQSSSSLLPVDSDHRGRLQLSIGRAETMMNHERACAILRYAMDDVLRSGLRAGVNVPLPDLSNRADVVLNRPKGQTSVSGVTGLQSSEEALNSLVEEMREVMNAPVYNNTPLQSVATRFLAALADAQKAQSKNEEKLEQNLAKLKGDFLLARAEWEEKLNSTQETAEIFKDKYAKLKQSVKTSGGSVGAGTGSSGDNGSTYLDHARSALASQQQRMHSSGNNGDEEATYGGFSSVRSSVSRAGSQVSLGSGLANHARSIVGSFACAGGNQRSGGVVSQELPENRDAEIREMAFRHDSGRRDRDRRRTSDKRNSGSNAINMSYSDRSFTSDTQSQSTARRTPHSVASGSTRSKSSRSFREYSRSPQRVDF